VKKYLLISIFAINSMFGFNNHFFGLTTGIGTIHGADGDDATILNNEDYLAYGFKTGLITSDWLVYADYAHMNFNNSGLEDTANQQYLSNFNEDYLSFSVGPVFEMDLFIDSYLFISGVLTVDKFHYSKEDLTTQETKSYLSQYQLFLGYQFGILFPVTLNPWHTERDSFFEFGYRSMYRSQSLLAGEEDESLMKPFSDFNQYYMSVNILF
jgi:hypothetical protein